MKTRIQFFLYGVHVHKQAQWIGIGLCFQVFFLKQHDEFTEAV